MERKYEYLSVIQGNYIHGWEDVDAEEKVKGRHNRTIRDNLKKYRENDPGNTYRLISRRVKK